MITKNNLKEDIRRNIENAAYILIQQVDYIVKEFDLANIDGVNISLNLRPGKDTKLEITKLYNTEYGDY